MAFAPSRGIPNGHDAFKASWRLGMYPPARKVYWYEFITSAATFKGYETYRYVFEANGRFQSKGLPEEN